MTTLSHPAPRPAETTAADRQPGPNQWIKDHLDSVIDAAVLAHGDRRGARPGTGARS